MFYSVVYLHNYSQTLNFVYLVDCLISNPSNTCYQLDFYEIVDKATYTLT